MASPRKIHPATLITNIKTNVPIQLDEDGSNFDTWVTLFKLHFRAHLVDSQILRDDSSKALVSKDSEWQRLDDIVRTWIYGSISPSLLQSIVRPNDCAFDAWNRLENNFQNNKTSRILHLESQFNDISLSNFPNVKSYCNELETIATSLTNLGTSISDNRLALKVLHGLILEYKTFRSLVQHMNPIPSFDTLRSMLELEERSNSALITTNKASFSENSAHFNNRGPPHHRGGLRHSSRGGRTHRGNHPGFASSSSHWQPHSRPIFLFHSRPNITPSGQPSFPSYSSPSWPYWAVQNSAQPAAPFPTTPWAPSSQSNAPSAGLIGPRPVQSYHTRTSASINYIPTTSIMP
ncbi:uncharacterized protein LOC130815658 [Amaranthus tricolor]|uniref:uncharacterized protein LOC130815658 n=1 Tax=Amaranthus tricolor TaxID=29722 RepID=UPI0025878B38|nr:uncharacterized protein LOC130815658 [Amaranthus tricolor]